uniref:ZM domain-containing protein n=1 Tax=Meloidogyne hapla TaxID=6305 RepID=A0A1I8B0K1_MELHA
MSSRGHSQDRALSQERETPFAGYGDRVGSGVAYAPAQWRGGELVTDPSMVTKSLKTRRFYYSPIGDGVVAADGVELKRLPPDLTPKVEVIQQRVVERAPPGKPGLRVSEKTWSTGGGESDSNLAYGSKQIGAASPIGDGQIQSKRPDLDPFSKLSDQLGPPHQRPDSAQSMPANTRNGAPKDQWMPPRDQQGLGGPRDGGTDGPVGRHGPGAGDGIFGPGVGGPYVAPSTRSTPGLGPATNGTGNFGPEFPTSGRSSGERNY